MNETENKILSVLKDKSAVKLKIHDNTFQAFETLKGILKEIVDEFNANLSNVDKRLALEYKDRGQFETAIKVAGDIIIFHMHTNVFEFYRGHNVWNNSYVQRDKMASYCGMINIYNFLYDSFKYSRMEDLGYLIGRIFINKDNHYFVEGKRQMGFMYNNFGSAILDRESLKKVVETAISYSLEFDLLVPIYEDVKIASVAQMEETWNQSRIKTGKRLGFKFNTDE